MQSYQSVVSTLEIPKAVVSLPILITPEQHTQPHDAATLQCGLPFMPRNWTRGIKKQN